ncbi:MAG: molybdopterin-dependent oxidoreductase [Actinobacteria bacterium]|nr:molybdopterin-dependent oxidoreductase [Actinomycetota bacterium]
MNEEVKGIMGFSRRNFIKGAAIVASTGALIGCSSGSDELDDASEVEFDDGTQIFAGVCRGNCAGGCFLNVHVRDGQVVRTSARDLPDTRYNRICVKGTTHVGRIYSADRIMYPMKRTGERGTGQFERISWEEAIDTIAEKWKAYTEEFGPGSMAVFSGSGNYAVCSGVAFGSAVSRFNNIMGTSVIPLNVDAAAGRAMGIITGFGPYGNNNEPVDFKNSKTFICWGANPTISQPQIMHFILDAKESGTKYIVIDEIFNANAAKADWFIPVKASTDGALAFGILNEIFAQGWQDIEFIRAHTNAPLLIKESDGMFLRMSDLGVAVVEGEESPYAVWDEDTKQAVALTDAKKPAIEGVSDVNGIAVQTSYDLMKEKIAAYPAEIASEITGVPAADIKELARIYHEEGPVNTYTMLGLNHYINGHYNYWSLFALGLCTGNVGKPGAATGFSELMPSNITNFMASFPADSAGTLCQGAGTTILINKVGDVLDTGQYIGKDLVLKGCYVTNTNPLATMADHEYTVSWFNKMEFIVVADMCLTETALYADIVLPAAHWFEQTDMFTSFGTSPYILWQDKAIEPVGEAKTDFEIYQAICEKMGYGDYWKIEPEDYIAAILDSDGAKALGITFDQFKVDKVARILPGEVHLSYEGGTFVTKTGRAQLYQEVVVPDYNIGQTIDESKEKAPYWEPSTYASESSEARKTYPFHLLSEHMRTRTHTQWWDCKYTDEYEPEPVLRVNPEDAAQLTIAEGDTVKMFNDRGYVVMKAVINAGLPRGTVSSGRSFQADEFIEGHFASLPPKEFNQVCANQSFNDVAVGIEKV